MLKILLCITATSVAAHAKRLFLNKQRNVDCPVWTLPFKILMVFLWSKRSLNDRIHTVANWFFTNLTWELHDGQASDFSAPGRPRLKACCRSTDCKLHRICSSFHCSRASRRFSECQKVWMNRWARGRLSRFDDILVVYRESPEPKLGSDRSLSEHLPEPGDGIPGRQRRKSLFWDTLFLPPS